MKVRVHWLRWIAISLAVGLVGCGGGEVVAPDRFEATDDLIAAMSANVEAADSLRSVADIDHARLAAEVGSSLAPTRVLIFSDPKLETELVQQNPLIAIDLPMRVLAYESSPGGPAKVASNSFDYLVSRYGLEEGKVGAARDAYEANLATVLDGIPSEAVASFAIDEIQPDGIITLESPVDFQATVDRVDAAIDSQSDAVRFGKIDFQANAREQGAELRPALLILFGAPGPGAKVMDGAQTLGLDGFCQKFLVWQGEDGVTRLSYNDLLTLARRQEAGMSLPLRVVNKRLNDLFEGALSAE